MKIKLPKLPLPRIFKKRWFQLLLILIIIFGGYFFWQNSHKEKKEVKTYTINRQDIQETVTSSGKVTAKDLVKLSFPTGGKLIWVNAQKGDDVVQWQPIASLDQRELEKRLKKAHNDYYKTRLDFDQNIDTNEDDIAKRNYMEIETIDDKDSALFRILQQNQLTLDNSVLDVEIADIAKEYSNLYAPISGKLIQTAAEHPGINVTAADQYIIIDPNTLRFSADIEESDIGMIKENMTAQITLDAFPDNQIQSNIESIDFTATTTTSGSTAYQVHFPIQFTDNIRLDMNGDVSIVSQEKQQVIVVPISAVTETADGKQVTIQLTSSNRETDTIQESPKTEDRIIQTGIETDDYYEVLDGLSEGETVILPE